MISWESFSRLGKLATSILKFVQCGSGAGRQCSAFQRLALLKRAHQRAPSSRNFSHGAPRRHPLCVAFVLHSLPSRCTLNPLTSRESFKPNNQLRPWDHTSTWRSVQQHPWQQHEQFPAPLLPHFIVATIAPRSFFQRQFQRVLERASTRNGEHSSSQQLAGRQQLGQPRPT